ncbi:chromosome segregation protein SMC [Haladaptatus sp. DJG-WS-42]|uniref:chromosome segregation protein SMC n=1 Tax=Haladaptatus sp. DJG-WS-42 TaxID=3120516 RepID=UPI0030D1615F
MHIKEIVLDNFKSFGRKTRIPFYEDFTTVSGPNGSGKSNIIDSVLFALGLARTRGIRAEKLTDLIYNPGNDGDARGDETREASVEVVLDNSERTLTRQQVVSAAGTENIGEVDDISIRRRVKETPENYYSYYYLNGRSVNLSDIQGLLAQAGITPEGYNVVMQGDVTGIIQMTPYERRGIIDEIAGVAEFDAKKDAAFEELEVVKDRIAEAELRIEEKQARLDQLKDERETALEYKGYREEKQEYEGYLKAAELEDKRADLAKTEKQIERHETKLESLQSDLDEKQGRVLRLEEELETLNAEIETKGEDEQLRIKREIEEVKGEIARLEDAISAAEERIQDAEQRRREAFIQIDRKQETVDDVESEIRETKVAKASVVAEIQQHEADLADLQAEIDAVDTEYDEVKTELTERREALEEAKAAKNATQREQDRLLDEARRRSNEQSEKQAEIETVREEIPALKATVRDLEDELDKAKKNRANISQVVDDLKQQKRELQDELDEVEQQLRARQQEYAELNAHADESGDSSYGRAVTTILNGNLDGVHGTVGQLGGVSNQYATACETAAGGRLAHVVVDDDGIGQQCIEYLKRRNAGRATFLPITKMHKRRLPSVPNHDGVVDFAYNLVDFDKQYAGIFSYVLGDTLVVDSIETARDLMGDFRLVTLSGELVEKSGAMTGGSSSGSRYSFSKSGKGQLERVAEKIASLEDERRALNEEIRGVEERLDDARDRKTDATDQVRDIEADRERVQGELDSTDERIEALEARIEEIADEREDVNEEMQALEADLTAHDERIAEIESAIAELESELADSKIPQLTNEMDEIRASIEEYEAQQDKFDARLNELGLEKQYAEESIEDLHSEIESAQNKKADQQERIADLEGKIEDQQVVLEDKESQVEDLEDELADLKAEREELKSDLKSAKQTRDAAREKVSGVESKLDSAKSAADRLEWEVDELAAQVGEYDPDEIPDHDEVKRTIGRLERKMEALEPVNMLAIDEYDEVKDGLDDLTDKKGTLVDEREAINDRIESYESLKKETFMDAFSDINDNFEDIFASLSRGSGTLHLENEADPFDGGLTMKAQPGDKPIQRLDAMSGGEKSLTALAFIFALQRYNPAPFYALDEVDAFLDAVNADLVGEMVDELAGDAQFVVVSHRSAMLERSERAIGVTMHDDNVSVVTGIDLSSQEVPADD